jgi:uroporphyrinogen decarboxylase
VESSRERVLKAIGHRQPETVPVRLLGLPNSSEWLKRFAVDDYFKLCDALGTDFVEVNPIYCGIRGQEGLSFWGTKYDCGYYDGSGYSTGREDYPFANVSSPAEIDRFSWPDPDDFDYEAPASLLRSASDKARMIKVMYTIDQKSFSREDALRGKAPPDGKRGFTEWIPVLNSLFNLFGFENTLMRLALEPNVIDSAIAHIEAFSLAVCRRMLQATKGVVDIVWYGDDFASQKGMLFSPETWRRFFKPTYRKHFELFKSFGLKVWFHSCGTFRPVLGDLVDIGMDVWETVQAHLPGNEPEILKREYGKDISFFGAINTQRTLPFGSPEEVRREVRERINVLGRGGGYICGGDHAILPDIPIDNVLAMIDEAKRFRFES